MEAQIGRDGTPEFEDVGRLLRVAGVVRALRREVDRIGLDERGRTQLGDVHRSVVAELRDLVSPDLQREIDAFVLPLGDRPAEVEIRLAQAQLAGWLEGAFAGIQAAMQSQQALALRAMSAPPEAADPPPSPGPGQYL